MKKKKKKKKQRIVFLTLTTESWILQSAILITTAIVDYAYVCRYDVMYVTRSVRQKEKIKKEKIIKYIGGERKALVEGSWIGATKLEVGFSRSSCPLGERSHGIRSLERNKGRVDPRSCCCESTFREQNPATIRDRDRANICIYTEW